MLQLQLQRYADFASRLMHYSHLAGGKIIFPPVLVLLISGVSPMRNSELGNNATGVRCVWVRLRSRAWHQRLRFSRLKRHRITFSWPHSDCAIHCSCILESLDHSANQLKLILHFEVISFRRDVIFGVVSVWCIISNVKKKAILYLSSAVAVTSFILSRVPLLFHKFLYIP